MKQDKAYEILERSDHPEMGANYLIADGEVHSVTFWAMGGVALRQTWKPGDVNFERMYMIAAANPNTMFSALPPATPECGDARETDGARRTKSWPQDATATDAARKDK